MGQRGVLTLIIAVGLAATSAAQETTGTVTGTVASEDRSPLPGVTVTLTDPDRGLVRSAASDSSGGYTVGAVPPGAYELSAARQGFRSVTRTIRVELGRTLTTDIEMKVGDFSDTIEVTGEAPQVDVTSTVSGITDSADELHDRLPIPRDVTRIALLAPGTVGADPRFNSRGEGRVYTPGQKVPVIAGASAAENSYIVNGLNITSFRRMLGSTYVPMEFVEQVQIKTGGYEAEYGRSTGGVVNLVTKSGSNTLRGGVSVYWNPQGLQANQPDTIERDADGAVKVYRHNADEQRESVEVNASLGGAIVRDRLFFFGFVRYADWSDLAVEQRQAFDHRAGEPYWGGKIDWRVSNAHRLEGTSLSDRVDIDFTTYTFDPGSRSLGDALGLGYKKRGGKNWIVRYTGVLRSNVLLSAQAGVNPFERTDRSTNDDTCPAAADSRDGGWSPLGCWINFLPGVDSDERTAYRADLDWIVGRHDLRAGIDTETNTSFSDRHFSGDVYYNYFLNRSVDFPGLPPDQELVRIQRIDTGGTFDVLSNSAYAQDSWRVHDDLTVNAGVRWEAFATRTPSGETFMEVNDQVAPRIGAVWAPSGDGHAKLYGSFGIYHLPMSSATAIAFSRGLYLEETWYPLVGDINADGSPSDLGEELATWIIADGSTPESRELLDDRFEPMSQSELIIGYERVVGDDWTLGVRGVARRFNEVIEDVSIDRGLWEKYAIECYSPDAIAAGENCPSAYRVTNPGSDFTGWYDLDADGELEPISLTAEELGYPDAERTYLAIELMARRRFAGRFMVQGSYTWSHLYGNYDGLVNSDLGQADPYTTQTFDVPALLEHADGDLPNDRRHNVKLFGTYAFDFGLQLGANAWFTSGRPVNGFGIHPTDPWARAYGDNYAFYNTGEPCPRGCGGRTDSAWAVDVSVKYDWSWLGAQWNARVDAFNVFDNDAVVNVDEFAELENFQPNPSYLLPRSYQPPRAVRIGFGMSF